MKIESIEQLENLLIDDFVVVVILVTDKSITAYFHNEIGILIESKFIDKNLDHKNVRQVNLDYVWDKIIDKNVMVVDQESLEKTLLTLL